MNDKAKVYSFDQYTNCYRIINPLLKKVATQLKDLLQQPRTISDHTKLITTIESINPFEVDHDIQVQLEHISKQYIDTVAPQQSLTEDSAWVELVSKTVNNLNQRDDVRFINVRNALHFTNVDHPSGEYLHLETAKYLTNRLDLLLGDTKQEDKFLELYQDKLVCLYYYLLGLYRQPASWFAENQTEYNTALVSIIIIMEQFAITNSPP